MKKIILIVVLVLLAFCVSAGGIEEKLDSVFQKDDLPDGTEQFRNYVPDTNNIFSHIENIVYNQGMEFAVNKIDKTNDGTGFVKMYARIIVTREHSYFVRFSVNNTFPNYALFVVVPELNICYYGEGTNVEDFSLMYYGEDEEWRRIPDENTYSDIGHLLNIFNVQNITYDRDFAAERINALADYNVQYFD